MRNSVVAALVVALVGGWRISQAEETVSPAATVHDAPVVASDDAGELAAMLRAAGTSARELAGDAQFRRALQLLRTGDHAAAQRGFEQTARVSAGLADWATYFAAWAAGAAGDTTAALAHFNQLDAEFRRVYAWRAVMHAFEQAGVPARALAVAHGAANNIEGPRRFEARVEAARLLVAQGDSARSRAHLRAAADSANTGTRIKAATLLAPIATGADDWLRIARAQRAAGRNGDALASFTRASTPRATFERAQVLFAQRKYAQTIGELKHIAGGNNALAAEAQLLRARAQLRVGEPASARSSLLAVMGGGSAATPAVRASVAYLLGDLAQDAGEQADARSWFRRAIDAQPGSESAAQAYMRLGLASFEHAAYADAAAIFEEFSRAHAQTGFAQQALFWSARAQDAARDSARARALMTNVVTHDQYSYYGLLAGEWLRTAPARPAPGPVTPAAIQQQARGSLRRAELLESLQLTEAASYEQERTRGHLARQPGGLHFLAEQLQQQGRISEAIMLGRRLHTADGRWNARTLKLIYPFPYRATIEKHAQATGLSPHLLAALIRQESMFNPRAKSAAGALGLMQVMPKTGRSVAGRLGIKRLTPAQLTNPETNVRIGAVHFRNLMKEHDQQLEHVIAAYNAGATPVARWRAQLQQPDALLFSERIPYAETRDYVKILARNQRMYELLYPTAVARSTRS